MLGYYNQLTAKVVQQAIMLIFYTTNTTFHIFKYIVILVYLDVLAAIIVIRVTAANQVHQCEQMLRYLFNSLNVIIHI